MSEIAVKIVLPLLALILFLLPKKIISLLTIAIVIIGATYASFGVANSLFSLNLPFMIEFTPLASVFAISVIIVTVASTIYSYGYLKEYYNNKSRAECAFHNLNIILLFFSMLLVLSSEDRFSFLFSWELMSLSSFVLILWNADHSRKIMHAALGYLVLMHIGFFLLLLGFFMLPSSQGLMGESAMEITIWLLFFIGFAIKVGAFPMHVWPPVAHPAAPSHISAIMSAAMLNMGVYGIFRATLLVSDVMLAGVILFLFGAVTALYGVYRSSGEANLKSLLAYSSIDNMGLILLSFGIGAIGKSSGNSMLALCGYSGGLIHMLCHSSFKSLLFMGSGVIQQITGTLNLDKMGGLLKKVPFIGFLLLFAVLSSMAIPPLSGFAGEFVVLGGIFSSFASGHNIILSISGLVIFALVGGTTILSMTKAYSRAMLSSPRSKFREESFNASVSVVIGCCISFLFVITGAILFPMVVFENSEILFAMSENAGKIIITDVVKNVFIYGSLTLVLACILFAIKYSLQKRYGTRRDRTWGCGADNLSSTTQYSASSYSSELYRNMHSDNSVDIVHNEGLFERQFTGSIKYSRTTTRKLLGIIHLWTSRLAYVQTGKVNHYVFHALIFMLIIGILSILGL